MGKLKDFIKRMVGLVSKEKEVLRADFNPRTSNWESIRDYIIAADADLLRAWIAFLVKQQIPCPKPFIQMAKRKIVDPRSFEFFEPYSAKKQLKEFDIVDMKLGAEEMLNITSPPRYGDEAEHLNRINQFKDWRELLDWKADLEFQGIKFSRIGNDLFEWKKERLYK